jgi:cytochrome c oxidase subunit 2
MRRFFVSILGMLLVMPGAHADWETNMPVGVTDMSVKTYDLHMFVLWVCVVIAAVVFGAQI